MSSYPSYDAPQQSRPLSSGMAIAALVLGILALVTFWTVVGGIVLGLVAIVLGVVALRRVRRGTAAGRGRAITGVVLGTVGLLLGVAWGALFIWVFNSDLADCVKNADGDQAKVEKCKDDFQRNVEDRS